ncbi:MAG: hypothetical protein EZS28_028466 [Streblomastix strix]|uniref:Uncharacterized protein n=1 Tax=Streblomastix strix TaxID=222440 RepID=A0A5J4UZX0_9EUKA|nr:MAG: hypothetical protein EZS28_028466 [Streblomastix strix]
MNQKIIRTLKWVGSDKNLLTTRFVRSADERIRSPAIVVERENQQLDLHAGQPLQVPENQPAKSDAVLPFMMNLLYQTARTPEEQQHQQQIASAQLLIEQYYDEKVADYDPTGKRPTKYELEALEELFMLILTTIYHSNSILAIVLFMNAQQNIVHIKHNINLVLVEEFSQPELEIMIHQQKVLILEE